MRSCSELTSEPAETVRTNFKRSGVSLANSASAFTIVIGEAVTAGAWRPAVLALRHMQVSMCFGPRKQASLIAFIVLYYCPAAQRAVFLRHAHHD